MKYSKPELVVLGSAAVLVQGGQPGVDDSPNPLFEERMTGVVLGLDE
jgi:hypothetical protein